MPLPLDNEFSKYLYLPPPLQLAGKTPYKSGYLLTETEVISISVLNTIKPKRRVINHGYKEVPSKKESSY